ncbi:hypothetical protein [Streptomyces olivaceus]|uniref:hypothetical protein n=1 Tax=Streptomyces olivaceus TaxID=47716 RepID=UPI0022ED65C5|nr:hypothetical protein [Streptomyces olivaceus]GHI91712.1 hypothetical protein TPA0905_11830 [Streptomyces olivaceus]
MSEDLRAFDLSFNGGPFDGGILKAQGARLETAPEQWFYRLLGDPGKAAVYERRECVDGEVPQWRYEYLATLPVIDS